MLYLGLDSHSKWTTAKGFNPETGEEIEFKKAPNDLESFEEAFADLGGPVYAVMESGTNSWAVYRMLEPLYVPDPTTQDLRAQGISRSRQDNPMRQTYWRVVLKGKNHAKIAVSRQLVRVVYHMLKRRECWDASKITDRRGFSASKAA